MIYWSIVEGIVLWVLVLWAGYCGDDRYKKTSYHPTFNPPPFKKKQKKNAALTVWM